MSGTDTVNASALRELLQQLIAIPSVNPSIAPEEAHGETAIATFVRDWLAAHGVKAWLEDAAPGRPNAVAEISNGDGDTLVLCAHLDTVGTAGMASPFEPRVEGRCVYGRGAYDMKGSAAAIMAAAVSLSTTDFPGRLLVALVADEEYASLGAFEFVRRHPADACIVTEPSEGKLILGHKGFLWAEIVTTGRAAHGSRWDLGESAISRMGRVLTRLDDFDRLELRQRVDPLVGPASMHCALIAGGTGLSTYASECRVKVERRTLPGETAAEVEAELREIVRGVDRTATVTSFFDRPALTCNAEARVVKCVRDAVQSVTGSDPVVAGVAYWMDAAVFASAGIETVNYGPTGAGAHETVEWVDLDSVVATAKVLVEASRRYLGQSVQR